MGRLVNSTYVTLDGVIESPQDWPSLASFSESGGRIQLELLQASDAVLMGRRTYEGFVPVWTSMSGDPYSDRINAMPKYVASTTLTDPKWNNTTVIDGDLAEYVANLKDEGNLVQYGFGAVSRPLLQAGLIDELRLWLHPFFVGRGDLIYQDSLTATFDLNDVTRLDSGVVILTYTKP
ncbi:dihydrofolate reductase family protein [Kribbella kalugense]|uniref:Dihydrofolate reductase n=1 Tax=Kribbella kalugense TaxID=2512221 RepID=A0A4R7ZWY2_9ACTN|nr:dihydrofolate reductase family protein [Kribbella kalugense]TDW21408.1 dihydrofolate reductase [Kribbella kalugense]